MAGGTMKTGRPTTNGLHVKRTLVCPCGVTFTSSNPGARYCSARCRVQYGRYGRMYGVVVPRQYGETT